MDSLLTVPLIPGSVGLVSKVTRILQSSLLNLKLEAVTVSVQVPSCLPAALEQMWALVDLSGQLNPTAVD